MFLIYKEYPASFNRPTDKKRKILQLIYKESVSLKKQLSIILNVAEILQR